MRLLHFLCVLSALSAPLACGAAGDTNESDNAGMCDGAKCDSARGWIGENLGGRDDAVARWLRTVKELDETDGVLTADYQKMQFGVAEAQGCDPTTAANYIISDALISKSEPFPRLVGTVCTSDESKNWQAFFSPPEANAAGTDLDIHTVEMFAWDPTTKEYRFYRTDPVEPGSDQVRLAVDPEACSGCHLAHRGLDATRMPMIPIMNELTQPWEHWNAEPGFQSQGFVVSAAVQASPNYTALTGAGWTRSARDLELIIRGGHAQVAAARTALRREAAPASVAVTMSLLRPLFCDEQVNYISEAGTSGQLLVDALIDPGLRDLVKKKQATGWGHKWLDPEARLRLPTAATNAVTMLPVRGNAVTSYEAQMTSVTRGVEVDDAIQIRLIDWERPVFSATRCGLWVTANQRLQRSPLNLDLDAMRNHDLLGPLIREIMQVDGVSLIPPSGQYYALGDGADLRSFVDAIASNSVPTASCAGQSCTCTGAACVVDLAGMVGLVEQRLIDFEADADVRNRMFGIRQERACIATACYENKPFIPNLDPACSDVCPLGAPVSSN